MPFLEAFERLVTIGTAKMMEISQANNGRPRIIWRTTTPRHYSGGDWDSGGKCGGTHPVPNATYDSFQLATEQRDQNIIIAKALQGTGIPLLDASTMTLSRSDAHPKKDCTHFCLPGPPDVWMDMFLRLLWDDCKA